MEDHQWNIQGRMTMTLPPMAIQGVDWRAVAQTASEDDADDVPADFDQQADSEVEVMRALCGKLAAAMPRVTPPPKTEGVKCTLSMLDIPDAVAGVFDIGMIRRGPCCHSSSPHARVI